MDRDDKIMLGNIKDIAIKGELFKMTLVGRTGTLTLKHEWGDPFMAYR